MNNALAFLSEMRRVLPPDRGSHALVVSEDGRLSAVIRARRISLTFYFEESDFCRAPRDLAAEIADAIARSCAAEVPSGLPTISA